MKRTFLALLIVLSLIAAACGGSSGDDTASDADASGDDSADSSSSSDTGDDSADDDTASDTGDDDAASDSGDDDTASDTGDDGEEQTFTMMWGTPAGSNYDPHTAFNPFTNVYLYPAYDRLIELTPEGSLAPMLAESWEFLEEDTVLRLSLRSGVTFHDGEPFDAEAVKANIERGKNLETSAVKQDLATIEEAVVVDDMTVDLMLSGPGAAVPALLADRAGMMVSPAAFDNEDLDLFPVGAGAFRVDEHQPGSVIEFVKFEDYWAPEMQGFDRLIIQMQLDPEARLRAMQDGLLDLTTLNPDQLASAESAGLDVINTPAAAAFLLYLNKTKPGLDDARVREAISLAIDREGIGDALHYGLCSPSSQIFPPSYWAGDPDFAPDPFDLEAARALMADAGYGDGLELSAVVVNVPFYVSQLEAIQAMLGEIGIDLDVIALEPTELLSRFAGGNSDMYYSQWPGAVDPGKTVASLLGAESSLNPGGYVNETIDALALEGLSVIEQDARAPIYQEISRTVAEDHFHIVVCNPEIVRVQSAGVDNVAPTVGGSFDLRGVTVGG